MKMENDGYYGKVYVEKETFKKLNENYFVSKCTDNVKFMCANDKEMQHLKDLGVEFNDVVCDWIKIILKSK